LPACLRARFFVSWPQGALSLSTLTLAAARLAKPFGPSVFSLPLDARMDAPLMAKLVAAGFSRVPVHLPNDPGVHFGYLLTKVRERRSGLQHLFK
jgi:hypothetical protein